MHGCEIWTIKKPEHQRIDAFELWYWQGLLRVPWSARRSNQSVLKEISPEYSLERLTLKLKLQYIGHLRRRTDSFEKTLGCWEGWKTRGEAGGRGWDGWMASPTQLTWVYPNFGTKWRTGKPGALQSMRLQSRTRLGNWTTDSCFTSLCGRNWRKQPQSSKSLLKCHT